VWLGEATNSKARRRCDMFPAPRRGEQRCHDSGSPMCANSGRPRGWPSSRRATKQLMAARLSAAWLAVLILSPFSAPFSTCDLPTPFHAEGNSDDDSTQPLVPSHSPEDWATTPALPRVLPAARLKVPASAELHSHTLVPTSMPRHAHALASGRSASLPSVLSTPLRL
jgi:hypothetical protein